MVEKRYIGKCGGCKKHSSLLASREKEAVKRGKRFVYRFVTAGGEVLYSAEASASLFDLEQACACGWRCALEMSEGQKLEFVREELTHTTDGPVSEFTVILRGVELAARRPDLCACIAEFVADFVGATSETVYASLEY